MQQYELIWAKHHFTNHLFMQIIRNYFSENLNFKGCNYSYRNIKLNVFLPFILFVLTVSPKSNFLYWVHTPAKTSYVIGTQN